MSNVTDIADQRPHAMIVGPNGNPHVVPIECLKRMADGRNKLINEDQKADDINLIRGLIAEWLVLNGY